MGRGPLGAEAGERGSERHCVPRTGPESHRQRRMGLAAWTHAAPRSSVHGAPALPGPTCTPWSSPNLHPAPAQWPPVGCRPLPGGQQGIRTRLQLSLWVGPDADFPVWRAGRSWKSCHCSLWLSNREIWPRTLLCHILVADHLCIMVSVYWSLKWGQGVQPIRKNAGYEVRRPEFKCSLCCIPSLLPISYSKVRDGVLGSPR